MFFFALVSNAYICSIICIYLFLMKKILLNLSDGLYGKIKKYKEENEFPSIVATIRYILNQFFKHLI
jgi:hypothetical protein